MIILFKSFGKKLHSSAVLDISGVKFFRWCQRQFSIFFNMINFLVKVGDKIGIRNGEGRSRWKSGGQGG